MIVENFRLLKVSWPIFLSQILCCYFFLCMMSFRGSKFSQSKMFRDLDFSYLFLTFTATKLPKLESCKTLKLHTVHRNYVLLNQIYQYEYIQTNMDVCNKLRWKSGTTQRQCKQTFFEDWDLTESF